VLFKLQETEYENSACKAAGERWNIRRVPVKVQERERISERCLKSYRIEMEYQNISSERARDK
jgi:hypothetical protein